MKPTRHNDETLLATWWVNAATWHAFAHAVRAYDVQQGRRSTPYPASLGDTAPSADGTEVVVREDALFVGPFAFDLRYGSVRVTLASQWLGFDQEGEDHTAFIPVPLPDAARADAQRVADFFNQRQDAFDRIYAEQVRQEAERRAQPTLGNRLLNLLEGHFALCALAFFFILLPAAIGLLYLAFGN